MDDLIRDMPKVELHLHLDGSLDISLAHSLSNINYDTLKNNMTVSNNCNSLKEYLNCFKLPLELMQTKSSLQLSLKELANTLHNENVIYAEVRFAPLLHIKDGLNIEEVVLSLTSILDKLPVKINLILCCMRSASLELNMKTIDIAYKYLNNGVCAIDLAGDEANYNTIKYKELFDYASKLHIPFTIHAGEASDYKSIDSAISFGARRIGHGINAIKNQNTINSLVANTICLEVCIKSNLDTKAVDNIKNHPIKKLMDTGIKVTLNTDNRTVSNTSLYNEYKLFNDNFDNSIDTLIEINRNAINYAFISDEEKRQLLNIIDNFANKLPNLK